ncbi:hypothetical protein BH11ACT7_BH11ACT7_04420 [soil metagenome]
MKALTIHHYAAGDPDDFCGGVEGEIAIPPTICDRRNCGFDRSHAGLDSQSASSTLIVRDVDLDLEDLVSAAVGFGYPMAEGDNVYRAFAQSDAATIRMYEREHTHDNAGPVHSSCILYSGAACPYLREPSSRLHKGSKINPGGKRGTRAAVMGFRNFAVSFHAGSDLPQGEPRPMIGYLGLDEDIPYRQGGELSEEFEAAVESDADVIDMSSPRLYWTDDPGDERKLNAARAAGTRSIRAGESSDTLIVISGVPYELYPL